MFGALGPVGMNWINVVRDAYAIESLKNLHIANLCPYLETEGRWSEWIYRSTYFILLMYELYILAKFFFIFKNIHDVYCE